MRRILLVLLVVALPGLAEKVVYSGRWGGDTVPILDKGHVIYLTRPNHVEVFDRDGLRLFQAVVLNSDGSSVGGILSAAVDSDETVAVTASVVLPQGGYGGVIVWFDRSGKQVRITDTGRFVPAHVCFDQNHFLWVFGWQRDEADWGMEAKQYSPVRKFSRNGTEEGRYLLRSTFPGWAAPFETSMGFWRVQAARDRIGALLYPGDAGLEPQWIEIDLDGKLIGRWVVGQRNGGMAYTEDGRLYKKNWYPKTDAPQLEVLERSSGKWGSVEYPVEAPGQTFHMGLLLGSDGNQLVFSNHGGGQLLWVDAR
jgi:hypothetical protein